MKASFPTRLFTLSLAALGLAGAIGAAIAEAAGVVDAAKVQHGKQVFEYSCASCHGAGLGMMGPGTLPGTFALKLKYQGKEPPALEDRKDLDPALVKYVVRHGIVAMPPYRKTEVSDADLDDLAAYLARNNP